MKKIRPYYNIFSKSFLIIIGIVYLLNYIYGNTFSNFLSLVPSELVRNLYLWQLLTFPFAPNGIESILFFGLVFYFVSPKLESYIEGLRYPIWLFLLIILQGCILTLVFINSKITITGLDGIAFYVLVVYSLLKPKDKIEVLNFPPMPIIAFALLISFLWFGLKLVNFSTIGNESNLLSSISSSLFGITSGLLHYLQIRFSGFSHTKNDDISTDNSIKLPSPEELSLAHSSNLRLKKLYQNKNLNFSENYSDILSDDMQENEDKLNEILDKIIISGKDSLTNFEKKFLDEYSKKL